MLGAVAKQANQPDITKIEIVTRAFDDPALGEVYSVPREHIDPVTDIVRLPTDNPAYLAKDALEAELAAFEAAFLDYLSRSRRPDVIHAHFADASKVALAARARWAIPVVYTPHSLGREKCGPASSAACGALARRIERERDAIQRVDAIVVSSRDEAERQLDRYSIGCAGRVHRIDPGVFLAEDTGGTGDAEALVDPSFDRPKRPLILAIARPVPKKNLPALIAAYAGHETLRDVANLAILAGQRCDSSGDAVREALRNAILAHGLGGRVALPPTHTAAHVPQLYRLAARRRGVFVNPALHEPFGLTVIEAAAAGLPVVATTSGAPPEVIARLGHGVCVEPTDAIAIGRAMNDVLTSRETWDARSTAATEVGKSFSWNLYAARTAALYRQIADKNSGRVASNVSKLVICDIDGTLTGNGDAARRFARWTVGGHATFAVATGRSISEARRVLSEWGIPEPRIFITSVGSEIWYADGCGRARIDETFSDAIRPGWNGEQVTEILDEVGARPQPDVEQRSFKRSYLGNAVEADRLRRTLHAQGVVARVIASHGDLIDVLPAEAGKAAAMAHVARRLGIAPQDCIAAGDSGNDMCMLREAGAAILPANAWPELRSLRTRGRLVRSAATHADGVLDGLTHLGLTGRASGPIHHARRRESRT